MVLTSRVLQCTDFWLECTPDWLSLPRKRAVTGPRSRRCSRAVPNLVSQVAGLESECWLKAELAPSTFRPVVRVNGSLNGAG